MRTWVDASTLIGLDAIGEIRVLRDLLGRAAITRQVEEEVFTGKESEVLREARHDWIEVVSVSGDARRWRALGLGKGEASMFLAPSGDRLLLDEPLARAVAESEGREYVGLIGLLLGAMDQGQILPDRMEDVVQRLLRAGFRLSTDLYDAVMR